MHIFTVANTRSKSKNVRNRTKQRRFRGSLREEEKDIIFAFWFDLAFVGGLWRNRHTDTASHGNGRFSNLPHRNRY